jgi:hypothetical protein
VSAACHKGKAPGVVIACICSSVQPTADEAEGLFSAAGLLLFVVAAEVADAVEVCPGMEVKLSSCTCSGRCNARGSSSKNRVHSWCQLQLLRGICIGKLCAALSLLQLIDMTHGYVTVGCTRHQQAALWLTQENWKQPYINVYTVDLKNLACAVWL